MSMNTKEFKAKLILLGWKYYDSELINILTPPKNCSLNFVLQYINDKDGYRFVDLRVNSLRAEENEDNSQYLEGNNRSLDDLFNIIMKHTDEK